MTGLEGLDPHVASPQDSKDVLSILVGAFTTIQPGAALSRICKLRRFWDVRRRGHALSLGVAKQANTSTSVRIPPNETLSPASWKQPRNPLPSRCSAKTPHAYRPCSRCLTKLIHEVILPAI